MLTSRENKRRLEGLNKIRKLPKLKENYHYQTSTEGGVRIIDSEGNAMIRLFLDYNDFILEKYHCWIPFIDKYLDDPKSFKISNG